MTTTSRTFTITGETADAIPDANLIAALGLNLHAIARGGSLDVTDATYTAYHRDRAGHRWALPTYGYVVGSRLILWTCTDEAGVADIAIVEDEDVHTQVRHYARALAKDLTY